MQYSYSLDGKNWENIGEQMLSPYQLKTFQGVRVALYAFNKKELNGGVADFDDFKVEEPLADRTANLPIGKTIRFSNLADGSLMDATGHGLMHSSSNRKDMRNQVKFVVEDRGKAYPAIQTPLPWKSRKSDEHHQINQHQQYKHIVRQPSSKQSFPYLYPPQQTSPEFSCRFDYRNYASIHVR